MMRLPITGFAQRVPDTVQRAMIILKDRKDPAERPEDHGGTGSGLTRPRPRWPR